MKSTHVSVSAEAEAGPRCCDAECGSRLRESEEFVAVSCDRGCGRAFMHKTCWNKLKRQRCKQAVGGACPARGCGGRVTGFDVRKPWREGEARHRAHVHRRTPPEPAAVAPPSPPKTSPPKEKAAKDEKAPEAAPTELKKKTSAPKLEIPAAEAESGEPLACEPCGKQFNGPAQREQHLASDAHARRLALIQQRALQAEAAAAWEEACAAGWMQSPHAHGYEPAVGYGPVEYGVEYPPEWAEYPPEWGYGAGAGSEGAPSPEYLSGEDGGWSPQPYPAAEGGYGSEEAAEPAYPPQPRQFGLSAYARPFQPRSPQPPSPPQQQAFPFPSGGPAFPALAAFPPPPGEDPGPPPGYADSEREPQDSNPAVSVAEAAIAPAARASPQPPPYRPALYALPPVPASPLELAGPELVLSPAPPAPLPRPPRPYRPPGISFAPCT